MGFPGMHAMLACEDYPSLKDRQAAKIAAEWGGRGLGELRDSQTLGWGFHISPEFGGGFIALRNLDDPAKYQSSEYALIAVDELTKNPPNVFDILRGSLRWPGVENVRFIAASNPGSIGHVWVKQLWIDRIYPPELQPLADEFAYVPALPDDNPHLDPSYWQMLDTLPDHLRRAWRHGDWDAMLGSIFCFGPRHIVKPLPVPDAAPLYMTYDYGHGAPYSMGWWWVDADNRLYRFGEVYGATRGPEGTMIGLRQTDDEQAEVVKAYEVRLGIAGRRIVRLCDPTSFNKKPDYRGGGQGPSTAEVWARHGLMLTPGDPSRILKIRQFHSRLRVLEDGSLPMLVVCDTCRDFIRTIPVLQADPHNPEDVDTRLEDHVFDEAALIVQARPLGADPHLSRHTERRWTLPAKS